MIQRDPEPRFERIRLPELDKPPEVQVLLRDRGGQVWAGGVAGLNRLPVSSAAEWIGPEHGLPSFNVISLAEDNAGAIWVGTERGICRVRANGHRSTVERCHVRGTGRLGNYVQSILPRNDGTLYIGTLDGPAILNSREDGGKGRFLEFSRTAGFSTANIESLAEDIEGNVWFGSGEGGGAMRLVDGAVVYSEADGLVSTNVVGFTSDHTGALFALSRRPGGFALHRFDGARFQLVPLPVPAAIESGGRGLIQVAVHGRSGDWWIASSDGVVRYDHSGKAHLLVPSAQQASNVFRLFEDLRGDLWISTSSLANNKLFVRRRSTGAIELVADRSSLPQLRQSPSTAFCEDRAGQLWVGFEHGGLMLYRDGTWEDYSSAAAALRSRVWASLRDSKGRIWIATNQGLVCVDGAGTGYPTFRVYSVADGLSTNSIRSLVEDNQGLLYLGSDHGVDQFDPQKGYVRALNVNNALPSGTVQSGFRDREGRLWFGTPNGVFRLQMSRNRPNMAPRIFISGLRVQGVLKDVSGLGETSLAGLELRHDQNSLEVTFAAIAFHPGDTLRYQYRIGSEAEWSKPVKETGVALAGLGPGSYTFMVRAAAGNGLISPIPATLTFRILPPFWREWWFLLLAAATLAALAYIWYSVRVNRLLETERLRTRIASDLHDDIGSSLTHIAILSEVAASRLNGAGADIRKPLTDIGNTSREVIDSLSDVVWAIDPRKDHLSDLSHRMRRWASDLLTSRNIVVRFESAELDVSLNAEIRRELFLIFKEAIHNLARHSDCSMAAIFLSSTRDEIRMEIRDDGRGFDPVNVHRGHGLPSMRARAARLNGICEVQSRPGEGSVITVAVPLRTRRSLPAQVGTFIRTFTTLVDRGRSRHH
jgi:signal transduction histidine kinase/ligand-binding sensor domain-containing protein